MGRIRSRNFIIRAEAGQYATVAQMFDPPQRCTDIGLYGGWVDTPKSTSTSTMRKCRLWIGDRRERHGFRQAHPVADGGGNIVIGRIFKRQRESREASTVATNGDLLLSTPSGEGVAVAQAAASLWERAFMAAVVPDVSPDMLASIGRTLFRTGDVVLYRRGRDLMQAASWDVQGGVERRTWRYDLQLPGPGGDATVKNVGYRDVAHVRINATPQAPWRGRGPLQVATITDALMVRIEQALDNEERVPVGQILAIPSIAQADTLADQVAALKGNIVLGESTAAGWDTGASQNRGGAQDWRPTRIGPRPPAEQVSLRRDVAVTVLAACGVPAGLVYQEAETGAREAWRRFLWSTIAPIGRVLSAELSRVFGRPVAFDWSGLFASDLAGRARAYKQLLEAGMADDDARRICGFD